MKSQPNLKPPQPSPNLSLSVKIVALLTGALVLLMLVTPLRERAVRSGKRIVRSLLSGTVMTIENPETAKSTPEEAVPVQEIQPDADFNTRRWNPPRGRRTVAGAVHALGPVAKAKFAPACAEAGIAYPPRRVALLAFKEEKRLEVWGAKSNGPYHKIGEYPILAASGKPGPKRREGDRQVPEGIYQITTLNPNSQFHLSLRVDYPNATDSAHRLAPDIPMGGDIYVHGNAVSIGCLAIGDPAIEEIFPLVATTQPGERCIIIAPMDLRARPVPWASEPWVTTLYQQIREELTRFPFP